MRLAVSIAVVVVLSLSHSAAEFKPITHLHSAQEAIRDGAIVIEGRRYPFNPAVQSAIAKFPAFFRAGVVGPDGFPDLMFGQSIIHPNLRCATNSPSGNDASCTHGVTPTFTYEWLSYVFEQGWSEYLYNRQKALENVAFASSLRDKADQILAFTYGYMVHASGDIWAHSLVNGVSRGIFPGVGEIAADPPKALIAARHIVSEGYIALGTPTTTPRTLQANVDFLLRTFIWDKYPDAEHLCWSEPTIATPLAAGSHFAQFLELRHKLCDFRSTLDTEITALDALTCGPRSLGQPDVCFQEIGNAILDTYAQHWIEDIDDGLAQWPGMSLDVATELFANNDAAAAKAVVERFALCPGLGMLGAPDAVGCSMVALQDALASFNTLVDTLTLKPLRTMLTNVLRDKLFESAFGITFTEFRDFVTSPNTHIDSAGIGLNGDTRTSLNTMMGTSGTAANPPTSYDRDQFAAFSNATILAKLVMLTPGTLDEMLFDLHVPKLYTGQVLAGLPTIPPSMPPPGGLNGRMRPNVVLGFPRSLDGNHVWKQRSPDFEHPPQVLKIGDGMLIWRDCLARERVFRKIFKNGPYLEVDVNRSGDGCEKLADTLPPVSMAVDWLPNSATLIRRCFGINGPIRILNHTTQSQRYSYYYRVWGPPFRPARTTPVGTSIISPSSASGGTRPTDSAGNILRTHSVVHREGSEALAPLSEREEAFSYATCDPGEYKVELFLVNRMIAPLESTGLNTEFSEDPPYFVGQQAPIRFRVRIDTPASDLACMISSSINCEQGDSTRPGSTPTSDAFSVPRPSVCAVLPAPSCVGGVASGLNADGDKLPDGTDNCPYVPNDDQVRSTASGPGDVCRRLPTPTLIEWAEGRMNDAAMFTMLERYTARRVERPPLGTSAPSCLSGLSCPEYAKQVTPLVSQAIGAWRRKTMSDAALAALLRGVQEGVRVSPLNIRVVTESLDMSQRQLAVRVVANSDGLLTVRIPKSLLGPGTTYRTTVDGARATATVRRGSDLDHVTVRVPEGAQRIVVQR
jgi:hypothetical protein